MKREHNVITSIYIEADVLEAHNNKLQEKYRRIEQNETMVEEYNCEGADVIVAAYGTVARVVKNDHQGRGKRGDSGRPDPSDYALAVPGKEL